MEGTFGPYPTTGDRKWKSLTVPIQKKVHHQGRRRSGATAGSPQLSLKCCGGFDPPAGESCGILLKGALSVVWDWSQEAKFISWPWECSMHKKNSDEECQGKNWHQLACTKPWEKSLSSGALNFWTVAVVVLVLLGLSDLSHYKSHILLNHFQSVVKIIVKWGWNFSNKSLQKFKLIVFLSFIFKSTLDRSNILAFSSTNCQSIATLIAMAAVHCFIDTSKQEEPWFSPHHTTTRE